MKKDIDLKYKLKKFISSMLKLSFLSWTVLLILWSLKILNFSGTEFLMYTTSVLGIGVYKKIKTKQKEEL